MGVPESDPISQLSLPPGFRFYPTDEELLVQYLCRKVAGQHFPLQIIAEIDLYKHDPWVLPSKAIFGEKEWYFFSPRDRKYPNGSRPNRVAGSGYWKATGTDKVITTEGRKAGIKKALVFYVGKAPKGTKTNWIMHEYRLLENTRKNGSSKLDDWVLCRIYKKNSSAQKSLSGVSSTKLSYVSTSSSSSAHIEDMLESLPEIEDRSFALPRMNSLKALHNDEKFSFHNLSSGNFDWASLAAVSSMPELVPGGATQLQTPIQAQAQTQGMVSNHCDDVYLPLVPQLGHLDEEVQSGFRSQRVESPGFFQQNHLNGLTQSFYNSPDPFAFRYSTHPSSFGLFGGGK